MATRKASLLTRTPAMAAVLALGALVADAALAQGPGGGGQTPGGGMKMFARCDTDGNGQISRAEFDACSKMRFEQVDANKDGKATLEEFQAQSMAKRQQRQQMMFQQMDTSGDGAVTPDEFDSMHDTRFEQIDADGDGAITAASRRPGDGSRRPGQGPGFQSRPRHGSGFGDGPGHEPGPGSRSGSGPRSGRSGPAVARCRTAGGGLRPRRSAGRSATACAAASGRRPWAAV